MVNIKLENVNKIFGSDVHVLKDVNLEIKDKEFMVLVGPSGCGKSTCLNIIAGLEYVTDGKVLYDDIDVTYLPPKDRRVAMVFQSYALYPHMNVRENMSFSLRIAKADKSLINKRVEAAAKILGISELLDRKPKELSGGQRQRIAVARAIAVNPEFIFLDEPTSSLDVSVQAQILNLLVDIQEEYNLSYLFVTHNINLVRFFCDKVAVMYLGRFMEFGNKKEVFHNPRHPYTQALFSANPVSDPRVKSRRITLRKARISEVRSRSNSTIRSCSRVLLTTLESF